jgi:soluble cytochrome b562
MSNVVQVQQQMAAGLNTIHAIQHQVLHRIRDIDSNLIAFSKHLNQITIDNIGSKRGMIVDFGTLMIRMIKDIEKVISNQQLATEVRDEMRKLHIVLDAYVTDIDAITHLAQNTNVKNFGHNIKMLNLLIGNMHTGLLPGLIHILERLDKIDPNSMHNRDNLIRGMQERFNLLNQQLKAA